MKNPAKWVDAPCPYCGGKVLLELSGKRIRHAGDPCRFFIAASAREVASAVINGLN